MVHAELYLKPGDVETVVSAVRELQKNKEKERMGMVEIMGMACAEMGEFWEGADLLNAFYGRTMRKQNVAARIIAFAKKMVEKGITPSSPANYNDLDDDLWAFVQDGIRVENLPDVQKVDGQWKCVGKHDVDFPYTNYTVYHDSHGHCYLFFVTEHYFMNEGVREVYKVDLHVRYIYVRDNKFKNTPVDTLWKKYRPYGDKRDEGWVLSATFRDEKHEGRMDQQTECEATDRAGQIVYQCQHFDAIEDEDLN